MVVDETIITVCNKCAILHYILQYIALPLGPMAHATKFPSFVFGNDGACSPNVLALPLGPMTYMVQCLLDPIREDSCPKSMYKDSSSHAFQIS